MAHIWPLGQVFEIVADVVRLGERVEIAVTELEQVHGLHLAEDRHAGYL